VRGLIEHRRQSSGFSDRFSDLAANCVHHLIARKTIPDQSIHDYMASIQLPQR